MRIAIAGAGNVGRSIGKELAANGHNVLLIDNDDSALTQLPSDIKRLVADACEVRSLELAELETFDVAIAASGDDKVNLVFSLLAKTEFGVPRTVGRINHPKNEWMFDDMWGVDVAISTPRLITAIVEEAVTVGEIVQLFSFKRSENSLVELTLPADSQFVGWETKDLSWPEDVVLVAVIRDDHAMAPTDVKSLEANDQLLLLTSKTGNQNLQDLLSKSDS